MDLTSFWPLLPLGFPLFWCGVVWLISRFGWHRLARHYRATAGRPREGRFEFMGSGSFGLGDYRGCLIAGVTPPGLYLSVWFLFRPGHPPLLIPWAAIRRSELNKVFRREELTLVVAPGEGRPDVRVTLHHRGLFPLIRVALGELDGPPPLPGA